jgi:mannose-6-phosphate isomerase-like protein (cupin superfamily)
LTLSAVKALYDAASFRISERKYPPGAAFPGRTRRCTWYVLRGTCILTVNDAKELSAGDVVDIDAGNYALRVTGMEELRLVMVWDLRPYMN